MLRNVKRSLLGLSRGLGLFTRFQTSRWRQARLLILCYHSFSRDDEHRWKPQLFMEPSLFRTRMELIRRSGANVLPLREAIQRLYGGNLPEQSVTITFDDGTSDFYDIAFPVLREYDLPATVYLPTYYCEHPYPVFHLICGYLLWKRRGSPLSLRDVTGKEEEWDLTTDESRLRLVDQLHAFARTEGLSAKERDQLAGRLAGAMGLDYDAILRSQLLQLMRPSKVEELAAAGVDFQLHTHRHRSPLDEELYRREIRENRAALLAITGEYPRHFCYPSGRYRAEFLPWLRAEKVRTATTCNVGLASPATDPLLLPRLVDVNSLSSVEFEGWITGAGAWLPRRPRRNEKGIGSLPMTSANRIEEEVG